MMQKIMKVSLFEEENYEELEKEMNSFLNEMASRIVLKDIKYQINTVIYGDEVRGWYSAMIIYEEV